VTTKPNYDGHCDGNHQGNEDDFGAQLEETCGVFIPSRHGHNMKWSAPFSKSSSAVCLFLRRFSAAGNDDLTTRSGGRRRKNSAAFMTVFG
jgi:hypothetical protein